MFHGDLLAGEIFLLLFSVFGRSQSDEGVCTDAHLATPKAILCGNSEKTTSQRSRTAWDCSTLV